MRHEKNTKMDDTLVLGDFRYHRSSGHLTQADGQIVHMRRQSLDVLSVLAAHRGEVVSKETLIEAVWPGIATTDDSLVQCIADIRRTLGRDVVETFPKRGYRLCPTTDAGAPIARHKSSYWPWAVLAASVAAITLVVVGLSGPSQFDLDEPIVPPVVSPDRTLAILPFANLSGDPDLRYFSDGLSEDLITDLSKVDQLTVISRASSFDFPDAEKDFKDIAESLGVRYLVRGTVRHHDDRIRINVSLVDPYEGSNLWADRFDWDMEHPFEVQEEVTRQIVQALSLTLGSEKGEVAHVEPAAYYMLLRGLEPLRTLTANGNIEARAYFERAVEFAPGYARAHANIAITYGRETVLRYQDEVSKPSIKRGLKAAITAIRFDPDLPEAYFGLGVLNLALGEYDQALAAARHSIKLDGNYTDGYALLAEVAVHGGDLDEALAAIQRAKLLHPRFPFSYDWIEGHVLFQLGRHEEARSLLEAVTRSNPDFYRGLITLAANYGQLGEIEAASAILAKARIINPDFAPGTEAKRTLYLFDDRRERLAEGLKKSSSKQ